MNAIRVIALSVLLAAGTALAEEGSAKKASKPAVPKPVITQADRPKSCADQCKLLEKAMLEPCKKGAGKSKSAQKSCGERTQRMVDACNGSCREKGRIDKQYMLERVKPPRGYKLTQEGAQSTEPQKSSEEKKDEGQ